eukprot:2044404-Prymnesium_polylepis.1
MLPDAVARGGAIFGASVASAEIIRVFLHHEIIGSSLPSIYISYSITTVLDIHVHAHAHVHANAHAACSCNFASTPFAWTRTDGAPPLPSISGTVPNRVSSNPACPPALIHPAMCQSDV